MTTGRINQVALLPDAARRTGLPAPGGEAVADAAAAVVREFDLFSEGLARPVAPRSYRAPHPRAQQVLVGRPRLERLGRNTGAASWSSGSPSRGAGWKGTPRAESVALRWVRNTGTVADRNGTPGASSPWGKNEEDSL